MDPTAGTRAQRRIQKHHELEYAARAIPYSSYTPIFTERDKENKSDRKGGKICNHYMLISPFQDASDNPRVSIKFCHRGPPLSFARRYCSCFCLL